MVCTVCGKEREREREWASKCYSNSHKASSLMELGVGTLPWGDDGLAQTGNCQGKPFFWCSQQSQKLFIPASPIHQFIFHQHEPEVETSQKLGKHVIPRERLNPPLQLISVILPIRRGENQQKPTSSCQLVTQEQIDPQHQSIKSRLFTGNAKSPLNAN